MTSSSPPARRAGRRTQIAATAIAAAIVALSAVATGVAAAPSPSAGAVAGSYTYASGNRAVSLRASLSRGNPFGTWDWTNTTNGNHLSGPVTCLVVDGPYAWLAGPTWDGTLAQFTYVHDGGSPGSTRDHAVTWISDPGQTLADMEAWCESMTILDVLFNVESGNVSVR